MPENISFVFAAFVITWLLICGYLLFLNGRIGGLRQDVEALRDELDARLSAGQAADEVAHAGARRE